MRLRFAPACQTPVRPSWSLRPAAVATLVALSTLGGAQASSSGVVISQVYGGGGNTGANYKNDFIELFNAGSSAVSLAGWSVQYASSTGSTWNNLTTLPSVTLQPGQYFLIQEAAGAGGSTSLPTPDATGNIAMAGAAGKVALVAGTAQLTGTAPTAVVDIVSYGSAATPTEGTPTATLTNTTAALRASGGCTDTNNNSADFATGAPTPRNAGTPLNVCGGTPANQPIVSTCPALSLIAGTGGSGTVSATDVDSIVNNLVFASAPPAGITLGSLTVATADGGTASAQILVSNTVTAGSYPLTLQWSNNEGQTASCSTTVSVGAANVPITPIAQIQGSGHISPLVNQTVTTAGVVTKVNTDGFFMQSKVPDNNPDTSDGIFVYTATAPTVSVGDELRLTGKVVEFDVSTAAGNPLAEAHTITELQTVTGLVVLSTGNSVLPTVITFPELNEDDLEKVEGMLVTINTELTVNQNYFLGRYGQVTLSAQGRLIKPTNKFQAGSADAINLAADNARRRILLDDGSNLQNPNPTPYIGADNTLRAGDTLPSITGVIDYRLATSATTGLADYAIHPTQPLTFTRANPRTAAPASVGGNLKVASFNVLNFFTTFSNGQTASGQTGQGCSLGSSVTAANCRGADSLAEFTRQRDKIVRAIAAINADVVGLMEIQNNGNTAVQNLVDALNAYVGAGTYAAVAQPTPISGSGAGTGTDAIRVAMIYKPGKLGTVGGALSDINAINNRPPLAQTFSLANGEKVTVVVNHFKSKSSCPVVGDADYAGNYDSGDGQGCWNARRQDQATQLRNFIGNLQSLKGDNDVLVIGDLNAYGKEDPILNLTGNGYGDLLETFVGTSDYSYVFDGEAGYIDHALATPTLAAQAAGAVHWHINADEPLIIDYNLEFKQPACATCGPDYYSVSPYRASDHDPVVVGLNLIKAITGTSAAEVITGTPGDDRITGGSGADTLTGNGGSDTFVYNSLRDALDVITDFTPGDDKLDLTALATTLRASAGAGTDLVASGYIVLVDTVNGLELRIDSDGSAGANLPRTLVRLKNVTAAQFQAARDLKL